MIELFNVTKKYGNKTAINNISLFVRSGEVLGLLGPNGAGKSTTMRIIAGYLLPTSGSVKVAGFDVVKEPVTAKRHIGYLPESPPLYKEMTVCDYINFAAELRGLKGKDKAHHVNRVIEEVGISDVKKRLIGHLSRGYRQRVGLAQALVANPQVLILDEPTVGLDPQQITEIRQLIKELSGKRTVILSSHILPEVSSLCHKVAIINKGNLIVENTPQNLGKSLMGHREIILQIKGPQDKICTALESLSGVKSIAVSKVLKENLCEYTVQSELDKDIRESLFYTMAEYNFPILEMKSSFMSLEEIFLELVTEEPTVASQREAN
ncbi:ABC transporter ATP-binding protein [Tepidanaerobacter acetatoxydans]|uniref:ABC transporter ATP-binding protein n=1 Tax=Tepidanaerobacter acetatoxydans TaxID=499229 RepID=UPI001BD6AE1E|nr:ABC transporter ATP-binding protein [Tepidanaerobacter acetatoxydans]